MRDSQRDAVTTVGLSRVRCAESRSPPVPCKARRSPARLDLGWMRKCCGNYFCRSCIITDRPAGPLQGSRFEAFPECHDDRQLAPIFVGLQPGSTTLIRVSVLLPTPQGRRAPRTVWSKMLTKILTYCNGWVLIESAMSLEMDWNRLLVC